MHLISDFRSYYLVYVDESGGDKRAGFRRTDWSPLGIVPAQVTKFHRDQLRDAGFTSYLQIASQLHVTHDQLQYTCQSQQATRKKARETVIRRSQPGS